jgi:hypothetical protein
MQVGGDNRKGPQKSELVCYIAHMRNEDARMSAEFW